MSLRQFIRETSTPTGPAPKADPDGQARLRRELIARALDLRADQRLAIQIIDVGYKALARDHHPDKGGSSEDMVRLNRVRAAVRALVLKGL